MPPSPSFTMVDWSRYLESLCNTYAQWWQVYTITDVVGRKREEVEASPLLFDFGLMVQTVEQDREERGKEKEKIERLTVLEGLRKYASEHVLLVGRPGSGKSTALVRLVLEEAHRCRGAGEQGGEGEDSGVSREVAGKTPLNPPLVRGEEKQLLTLPLERLENSSLAPPLIRGAGGVKIPVLVELRYYRTSILDLIQDFLQRHDSNLSVDAETLKTWLRQGQLLLLVDGLNELPSEDARRDLQKFRQDYQKTTPMIFTTRDLGVGGDLDITKKLEMQPLSEAQMQQFVHAYLSEQGEQMLRQLGSRLREFGQTPLLLWMLCSLFRAMGKVPPNLGLVFRQFATSYDRKLKQDIPISKESRRWWHRLLEQLAWVMTCGEEKTELQVAIPRQQAEAVLMEFLAGKVAHPEDCALGCLEDLLNHHLIQLNADNQIEFRHQLIQEYYTAECLLKLLASLSDDELKREYLNYLKWTEPLTLMLELEEDEAQAMRVVKLALEVDLSLGAKLAGAVKPEWHEQTVALVVGLELPQQLKTQLLDITHSESVIPGLLSAAKDEDSPVDRSAASAIGEIGSEEAVEKLLLALKDEDFSVRNSAASALRKIANSEVLPYLFELLLTTGESNLLDTIAAIQDRCQYYNHTLTAYPPPKEENNTNSLMDSLNRLNQIIRTMAEAPKYDLRGAIIESLVVNDVEQSNHDSNTMSKASKYNLEGAVIESIVLNQMEQVNDLVTVPALRQSLENADTEVRKEAVAALGEIGNEAAISALVTALQDSNAMVRTSAAEALGKVGSEEAISALVTALQDSNTTVRASAAEALGTVGSEKAISALVTALQDSNTTVRVSAAEALGKVGSEEAIFALVTALQDSNTTVRASAAEALGKVGSEEAISTLIQSLKDTDTTVRASAAEALGKVGSEEAISALRIALQDQDARVRVTAAEGLARLGISAQNIAESAAEINDLLKQLAQAEPTMTEAKLLKEITSNPVLKERLRKALNAGGIDALKAIFNHPSIAISIEAIKGWIQAE